MPRLYDVQALLLRIEDFPGPFVELGRNPRGSLPLMANFCFLFGFSRSLAASVDDDRMIAPVDPASSRS